MLTELMNVAEGNINLKEVGVEAGVLFKTKVFYMCIKALDLIQADTGCHWREMKRVVMWVQFANY